jgi:hypothetical protein
VESPALTRRALVASASLAVLGCAGKVAIPQPGQTSRSALDALRKNIRKHVEDKQARERALAKVDKLRDLFVEFDRLAFEWRIRSHDAGPHDERLLLVIADEINARMREQILQAARILYSLRDDIPASMWTRVFPAHDSVEEHQS